jgi:SAM-dependent methyltransferase
MACSTDYRQLVAHYEACLRAHGDNHRGVDWPNAEDARTRYRVMLDLIQRNERLPARLLDLGCGASHLYEYIREFDRSDIDYAGLDLSAEFVELSRAKFPDRTYYCLDILDPAAEVPKFDYVVMNGVFTEKCALGFAEMWQYVQAMLARAFDIASVGIAFNVMSKQVDWERGDLFHLSLDLLAEYLTQNLSRHFVIRNNYGLYEYTAYVYHERCGIV